MEPILTGVNIDVSKSSAARWYLYFVGGTYEEPGLIKTIEDFIIRLRPEDFNDYPIGSAWNIMYNPYTSEMYLHKIGDDLGCTSDIDIGGFILYDCRIQFINNESSCITYNRVFTNEYDSDFNHIPSIDNCEECAGEFDQAFYSPELDVYVCSLTP